MDVPPGIKMISVLPGRAPLLGGGGASVDGADVRVSVAVGSTGVAVLSCVTVLRCAVCVCSRFSAWTAALVIFAPSVPAAAVEAMSRSEGF